MIEIEVTRKEAEILEAVPPRSADKLRPFRVLPNRLLAQARGLKRQKNGLPHPLAVKMHKALAAAGVEPLDTPPMTGG